MDSTATKDSLANQQSWKPPLILCLATQEELPLTLVPVLRRSDNALQMTRLLLMLLKAVAMWTSKQVTRTAPTIPPFPMTITKRFASNTIIKTTRKILCWSMSNAVVLAVVHWCHFPQNCAKCSHLSCRHPPKELFHGNLINVALSFICVKVCPRCHAQVFQSNQIDVLSKVCFVQVCSFLCFSLSFKSLARSHCLSHVDN